MIMKSANILWYEVFEKISGKIVEPVPWMRTRRYF